MQKKYLKLLVIIIFLAVLFINSISFAKKSEPSQEEYKEKTFTLAAVQEDYKQLNKLINLYHSKVFVNMDEFNILYISSMSLLHEGMGELEFFRVISPLVSKLNCAHSSISLSSDYIKNIFIRRKVFPVTIRLIDNKIYAHKDIFSTGIPLGSEILNINGKQSTDIVNILLDNIPADGQNLTYKYYKINYQFAQLYYYYIDDSEEFIITYKHPENGNIYKITISGVLLPEVFSKTKFPNKSPLDNQIIKGEYAILRVPSFSFYKPEEIQNFKNHIDEFFYQVKKSEITNLILDLRYNTGGFSACSTHLFSYFISEETSYYAPIFEKGDFENDYLQIKPAKNRYKGNLYILINGGSYSATGLLCSLLKSNKIGFFIGEETGGSFICQGYKENYKDFVLTNTKLNLEVSSKIYQTLASGLTFGRGTFPDYVITPTIQDYLNEKDVELEFAVRLIKKENSSIK